MDIKIREAETKDKSALHKLMIYLQEIERKLEPEEKNKGEEIVNKFYSRLLSWSKKHDGIILIGEIDGNVAGFISCYVENQADEEHLKNTKWLYISDIAVFPEYQGLGVGKLFLKEAERYAKKIKLNRIKITMLSKNTKAMNFYHNNGYRDFELTVMKIVR